MAVSREDVLEIWDNLELLADISSSGDDVDILKSFTNEAYYVGRWLSTNIAVPGNIHKMELRSFWVNSLKPSEFVMKTIVEGYELPFTSIPPPSFESKNASARNDMQFVREEVKRLEKLGCIKKVDQILIVCFL